MKTVFFQEFNFLLLVENFPFIMFIMLYLSVIQDHFSAKSLYPKI